MGKSSASDVEKARARLWHQPEVIAVLGELVPLSQELAPGRRKAPKSGTLTMSLMAVAAAGVVFAAALALGGKPVWAAFLFHPSQVWLPPVGGKSYVTAIGEARTVGLPDNSTAQLNTRTRMIVNYGATSRDVTLRYGEAALHVVRDDRRPVSLLAGRAWQHGMIVLRGARLQDALAEVDRYTNTQFVLADDRMRDIRIGGDFRTGDIGGLLQSLKKDFRIDSRRDFQGRVVLTSLTGFWM